MLKRYSLLGEYMVAFETICHQLRWAINNLRFDETLNNQVSAYALTSELSAGALVRAFRSIASHRSETSTESKVLDAICLRLDPVISERNKVLHSMWYVDPGAVMEGDKYYSLGIKNINTKAGVVWEVMEANEGEFRPKIDEALDLADLIYVFSGTEGADWGSFDKSFTFQGVSLLWWKSLEMRGGARRNCR